MRLFRQRQPAAPPTGSAEDRWAHLRTPPVSEALRREHSGDVPEHGLVRPVWTEHDFAALGWHFASLWAFEVQHGECVDGESQPWPTDRVALDLDYITRWVAPQKPSKSFTCWVAPCTLVFSGVSELELNFRDAASGPRTISEIYPVRGGWHVAGAEGFDIKLAATGFRQTFRHRPVHGYPRLELAARGGYSFSETPATLC